jgi:hypothetical protein
VEAAGVERGHEAVDRARAALQCRGGLAEALRGPPGDGDAVDLAAGLLLGMRGGVDHDALAGAGRSDEHRGAAGAGDRLHRLALLGRQVAAEALLDGTDAALAHSPGRSPARGRRPCR